MRRENMRRSLLVVVLACFVLMFVGQAMAQEGAGGAEWSKTAFDSQFAKAKEMKFTGTVVSHDPMCHCVIVKTPKGELTLQDDYAKFMQEYNQAKGLKVGAEVTGVYKTVNHIHYLSSIMYKGM
jgi:hypothetical protein